jgi:hypothetical protein
MYSAWQSYKTRTSVAISDTCWLTFHRWPPLSWPALTTTEMNHKSNWAAKCPLDRSPLEKTSSMAIRLDRTHRVSRYQRRDSSLIVGDVFSSPQAPGKGYGCSQRDYKLSLEAGLRFSRSDSSSSDGSHALATGTFCAQRDSKVGGIQASKVRRWTHNLNWK